MSDFRQDRDVVTEGRRKRLKDVEAPLRDQAPEGLYSKLKEMGIGEKVASAWAKENAARADWLARQRTYLNDWDEFLESTSEGPFQGSSSLHIPMPMWVAKTFHARFLQALAGTDPPFVLKARQPGNEDRVPMVQDTLRYALMDWMNDHQGVEGILDEWLWDWVTAGIGILKQRWDVRYTRFWGVEKVAQPAQPTYSMENGRGKLTPNYNVVEEEKYITKKCFEGPMAEKKDIEDIVCVGGNDPQTCDMVIDRNWITASEAWTLVDRKIFRQEAVEKMINGGDDPVSGALSAEIKQQRSENAGITQLDTESDQDRYEVLEAYLKLDVDGSGIASDIVVWVHTRTREVLRATYLYRINKSGQRPYFQIVFHQRSNQKYPIGLIEMLHPLSVEMDAMHNMRIDVGMLTTMPFGFYRPTSSVEPETLNIEPGALIPLDNPQTDIYFPTFGNRTAFGFQEEQALVGMVERLTSISDISLGIIGGQGATRTATGTRAIVGEANANLDVYLRRMNRGWKQFLRYLLHSLQQRIPPGLAFRVTGDDGHDYWRQVYSTNDIAGDYDFELSANSANSNRAIQQETADMVMQSVADPLAIQLGIVTPSQYYEAKKNQLQSRGIRDYGRFLQKPAQGRIYTPEEEANKVLLGIDVPVTPEQDHQGFLAFFEHILQHDELLGWFDEQQTVALAMQAKRHEEMLAAIQQMEAQAANQGQMRMNAAMSQQQAPVGMSPMAAPGGTSGPVAG